jgi:hypothetical protein
LGGQQASAAGHRPPALALRNTSMTDTDSIILGVAAFLFAFALITLTAWAFKTFVLTGRNATSLLRGRDRRLAWWRRRRLMRTASSSSFAAIL